MDIIEHKKAYSSRNIAQVTHNVLVCRDWTKFFIH